MIYKGEHKDIMIEVITDKDIKKHLDFNQLKVHICK